MKKSILILAVALLFLGCNKEEICEPTNCGIIVNDGIDANNCYWLEIQNNCSQNNKKFCFDENVWLNNYVGDSFCVTNEAAW